MNVWEESGIKGELLLLPPDHKYNTPPVALRVMLSPSQIGDMVSMTMFGRLFTEIVMESLLIHPLVSTPDK